MNSLNAKDWILSVYQTQRLKHNQLVTTNPRTFAVKANWPPRDSKPIPSLFVLSF